MYIACQQGLNDIVSTLLAANPSSVNQARQSDNLSPLMIASYFGELSITKKLLGAGANIMHRDNAGYNAFSFAAKARSSRLNGTFLKVMYEYLQSMELDNNMKYQFFNACENKNGYTGLHLAAMEGNGEAIKFLRDNECNVNWSQKDFDDKTAADHAFHNGYYTLAYFLSLQL